AAYSSGFPSVSSVPAISIETRSLPTLTRRFPRSFTLITRTAPCFRQLPALPSTRVIPDRDVFYVADRGGSIRRKSPPSLNVTISRPVSLPPPVCDRSDRCPCFPANARQPG